MDSTVPTDSSPDSTVPLSGVSQRHGTSPLDSLSHLYSTPHMQSTGQMKYRWETNLKIKHKKVDKMSCNHSAGILKGFCLSKEPKKG